MKKSSIIITGVVSLVVGALLAFGITYAVMNSSNTNKALVTMKGDTVTVSDFYKEVKENSSATQTMLTTVLNKVLDKEYGNKVSSKDVTKAYNKEVESYGSSFSSALTQAGMTESSYKTQIRTQMLLEYAVKQAAKKELTTANYKTAYKSYNPTVTAQIIKLSDEDTANSVLKKAKDGDDFSKLAKDNSTDSDTKSNGGTIKFDSASSDVPDDVKTAAFKLKNGEISDVISVTDSSTYETSYYIVKMNKTATKNKNWKTYKSKLKSIILSEKENDSDFQTSVISSLFKKYNVTVKDSAFQSVFSTYMTTTSSSSSTSSSN